jgi:hypothetical protein
MMRLTKALLAGVAALGFSTGAAFAGGDSMSHDSMSQDLMPQESDAQPMEYEAYDVYIVPAEDVVFIPFEPSEPPIAGNELG